MYASCAFFLVLKRKKNSNFLFSSAVQKEQQSVHPTRPFASRIVGQQCYLQPFSLCHLCKCFLVPSFSFLIVYLKCFQAAVPFQFEYLRNRLVFSLGKHFLYYASNPTKRWSRRNLNNFSTRIYYLPVNHLKYLSRFFFLSQLYIMRITCL